MKWIFVSIFFIGISLQNETDYRTVFTFDYTRAIKYIHSHKDEIALTCNKYNTDTGIITSVFFPELIRYSMMHNYFETKALQIIYIRKGSQHADFSIGRMQMKPSFIETLEEKIKNNVHLQNKYNHLITFDKNISKSKRRERLHRLNSFEWQMDYINAFYDFMEIKYNYKNYSNKEAKIRFYATAYNHGFTRSEDQINRWMNKKIFPYGMKSNARQYAYSKISVYFYQKNYKMIFVQQ